MKIRSILSSFSSIFFCNFVVPSEYLPDIRAVGDGTPDNLHDVGDSQSGHGGGHRHATITIATSITTVVWPGTDLQAAIVSFESSFLFYRGSTGLRYHRIIIFRICHHGNRNLSIVIVGPSATKFYYCTPNSLVEINDIANLCWSMLVFIFSSIYLFSETLFRIITASKVILLR